MDKNNFREADITESMMAATFLAEHFGQLLLLHVHLDSYYTSNRKKQITSIEGLVDSFDTGTKIINKMTEYVDKSIYADWLFVHSVDDIINLSFGFKDIDLLCEILTIVNTEGSGIYLSYSNVNHLISLFRNSNDKKTTKGAPSQSYFHKDYTYSKQAIIAGVLSAGRKKISGVKTLINVQEQTAMIVGVSPDTVKKNCYSKNHNPDGVECRICAEGIASRIFKRVGKNEQLPIPTPIECYMVLFKALFYDNNVWTGEATDEGVPVLKMV